MRDKNGLAMECEGLGKVLRLLVAFIDTFLHNFDIYIDGTY